MVSFVAGGAVVVAVVALVAAFKKHKSLTGIKASIVKEVAFLDALEKSTVGAVKADYQGVVARIKALL